MNQLASSNAADEALQIADMKAWADACMDAAQHSEPDEAWLLFDIASALLLTLEEAVGDKKALSMQRVRS